MASTVEIYDELTRISRVKNGDTKKARQQKVLMSDTDKREAVTIPEAIAKAIMIMENYLDVTPRPPKDRNREPRFDLPGVQCDEWQALEGAIKRLREMLYVIDPPPPHEYWPESLDIYVKESE